MVGCDGSAALGRGPRRADDVRADRRQPPAPAPPKRVARLRLFEFRPIRGKHHIRCNAQGMGQMADDKLPDGYRRNVFKGAWKNTLRRVGWDPTKIILAVAAFIGSWMLGGI